MYDNQTKDKFVELRAAGKSFGDIAQELGVVKSTLHRWEDERADDIARLRRIEWEEKEHRWGRNIEELMTDLTSEIMDYEMRLRQFTDNLNNLSLRDSVMLLRESRREYFRLRAMLMGTAPRPRSIRKSSEASPRAAETKAPNGVHDRLSDSSEGVLSCPLGATTEHGLQRPVTEEQQRGSAKAPEESNETERSKENDLTQHRNTNDLQQPESQSFDSVGAVHDQSQIALEGGAPPLPESSSASTDSASPRPCVEDVSSDPASHPPAPNPQTSTLKPPPGDDSFLGSIVISPYECGAAVVLKTLEQEATHRAPQTLNSQPTTLIPSSPPSLLPSSENPALSSPPKAEVAHAAAQSRSLGVPGAPHAHANSAPDPNIENPNSKIPWSRIPARNSESTSNDQSQLANHDSSLDDFGGESIPINPLESTREWLERQGIHVSKVPEGARIITSP